MLIENKSLRISGNAILLKKHGVGECFWQVGDCKDYIIIVSESVQANYPVLI